MNKNDFLLSLADKLSFLPREEVEDRWLYYSEMIDDRMEEGLTEQAAVAELGSADKVAEQILSDIPLAALIKERVQPKKGAAPKRRWRAWEIVLLVLGSPVWLSLLIAGFAVVLSVYVSVWAVIVSLWAVFVSLAAAAAGSAAAAVVAALGYDPATALAFGGAALVCAGFAVFMFFGCTAASKGTVLLTKKLLCRAGRRRAKKEERA